MAPLRLIPRRLVFAGGILVDVLVYVDRSPEPGGVAMARKSLVTPGGGFNVLVGAVRLGLSAAYGGLAGTGPYGRQVVEALAENGIELLIAPIEGEDTGFDVGIVELNADTQPTFIGAPGIESKLGAKDLARMSLRGHDAVYVSGYDLWYPEEGAALAAWAAELGPEFLLVFDPGPLVGEVPRDRLEAVLGRSDLVSTNMVEASLLVGDESRGETIEALARRLPAEGWVVVRAGVEGCWVCPHGGVPRHVAARRAQVVDTTGAGDAHVAALLARLAAGDDVVVSARWANVAASLAIESVGPSECPSLAELTRVAAEAGLSEGSAENEAGRDGTGREGTGEDDAG